MSFRMTLTRSAPRPALSALRFAEGSTIAGWYDIREDFARPDGPAVWLAAVRVIETDVALQIFPLAVVADAPAMPRAAGDLTGAASEEGDPLPVRSAAGKLTAEEPAKNTQARQSTGPTPMLKAASRKRPAMRILSGCHSAVGRLRPRTTSFRLCLAALIFATGICVLGVQDDTPLSSGGFRPRMERNGERAWVRNPSPIAGAFRPFVSEERTLLPQSAPIVLNPVRIGTPMHIDEGRGEVTVSATSTVLVPKSLAEASEDPDAVDLSFEKPRKKAKTTVAQSKTARQKPEDKTAPTHRIAATKVSRPTVTSTGVTSIAITAKGP